MNKLTLVKNDRTSNVDMPGVNIHSAIETAESASRYASQLQEEYMAKLHKAISLTDVNVAGRFLSLINELTFMSKMTVKNLKDSDE